MPDEQKIQLIQFPFRNESSVTPWGPRTEWPAHWIQAENPRNKSTVTAYCLDFTLEQTSEVEFHVTADQRYWLYLDAMRIGRAVSVKPGFLLAASTPFTEQFSTGIANWQVQELDSGRLNGVRRLKGRLKGVRHKDIGYR